MNSEIAMVAKRQKAMADEWCALPVALSETFKNSLRSHPDITKEAILRFPLFSVVEATIPLEIPAQGRYGVVVGYTSKGDVAVADLEASLRLKTDLTNGVCDPEWLTLIACRYHVTSTYLARIIGN